MKRILLILLLVGIPAIAQSTRYLHVAGQITSQTSEQVYDSLNRSFIAPLVHNSQAIRKTFVVNVTGTGAFEFDAIVEPMTAASQKVFDNYIAATEKAGFAGAKVRFRNVKMIFETALFEAGNYSANQEDDPFVQTFQTSRSFAFSTLDDWTRFTDAYGNALLSKQSRVFQDYLAGFIGDKEEFQQIETAVLTKNNMVAIDPKPYVILEDNTVIEPDNGSPFIPFRFFRNCWWSDYENGVCVKSSM